MASAYQQASERADEHGLITIDRHASLACYDCGYTDVMAYAIGPCPECGSARAGAVDTV